jgi:hypothetical protein
MQHVGKADTVNGLEFGGDRRKQIGLAQQRVIARELCADRAKQWPLVLSKVNARGLMRSMKKPVPTPASRWRPERFPL